MAESLPNPLFRSAAGFWTSIITYHYGKCYVRKGGSARVRHGLCLKNHLSLRAAVRQGMTSAECDVSVGKQCWSVGKDGFNPAADLRPQA